MTNLHVHTTKKTVKAVTKKQTVAVKFPGTQGFTGPQWEPGPQGPQGPSGIGDKTYTVNFSFATSVLVTHNLGKYPSLLLKDTADTEVVGFSVQHHDTNSCTVSWLTPFTGMCIAN